MVLSKGNCSGSPLKAKRKKGRPKPPVIRRLVVATAAAVVVAAAATTAVIVATAAAAVVVEAVAENDDDYDYPEPLIAVVVEEHKFFSIKFNILFCNRRGRRLQYIL